MANETKKVLGVDIGGTKIAICIADTNGEIVASDRVPSGATAPYDQVMPQIIDVAKKVAAKKPAKKPVAKKPRPASSCPTSSAAASAPPARSI